MSVEFVSYEHTLVALSDVDSQDVLKKDASHMLSR